MCVATMMMKMMMMMMMMVMMMIFSIVAHWTWNIPSGAGQAGAGQAISASREEPGVPCLLASGRPPVVNRRSGQQPPSASAQHVASGAQQRRQCEAH